MILYFVGIIHRDGGTEGDNEISRGYVFQRIARHPVVL